MENKLLWYAVMQDNEDNDWGYGSYNLQEAKKLLLEFPDGYIAVIDDTNGNAVCVDEIR